MVERFQLSIYLLIVTLQFAFVQKVRAFVHRSACRPTLCMSIWKVEMTNTKPEPQPQPEPEPEP